MRIEVNAKSLKFRGLGKMRRMSCLSRAHVWHAPVCPPQSNREPRAPREGDSLADRVAMPATRDICVDLSDGYAWRARERALSAWQ